MSNFAERYRPPGNEMDAPLAVRGDRGLGAETLRSDSSLSHNNDDCKNNLRHISEVINPIRAFFIDLITATEYSRKRSLMVDRLTERIRP
jgi:hypothetical protein